MNDLTSLRDYGSIRSFGAIHSRSKRFSGANIAMMLLDIKPNAGGKPGGNDICCTGADRSEQTGIRLSTRPPKYGNRFAWSRFVA